MSERDIKQDQEIDALELQMEAMRREIEQLRGIVPEPIVPFKIGIIDNLEKEIKNLINYKDATEANLRRIISLKELIRTARRMVENGELDEIVEVESDGA